MLTHINSTGIHTKILRVLAVLAILLLAGILYVALVGISVDASGLRGKVAAMLTQSIGREVRLDGPLLFELSAHPKLSVAGLHIANAAGFAGDEFASMGEARLALNLGPLLRAHLQIEELAGSAVHIRLQLNKDGRSNWIFTQPDKTQDVQSQPASQQWESLLASLDIQRVSLEKLEVEFSGASADSHYFELQSLLAQFPAGQALTLAVHGTVEKIYPYQLEFTGGTLADLLRSDQPWPVELTLGFMSSRLALNGSLSGASGELNFGLGTENLSEFEQLFQTKLPAVGVAGIAGTFNYAPGKIALNNLKGVMGRTMLNGALAFDYSGERPRVQGELELPLLDLRPFLTGKPAQAEPAQSMAEIYREISLASFSLNDLNSLDADLTVRVGQWLNIPGAVHDATLQVKLGQGRLVMPLQATVADVVLNGSASADASVSPARFQLALGARDSSLGKLAGLLFGVPGIQGQLGRIDLHVVAQGERGADLMQSLDVRLDMTRGKLAYGTAAGERPVQFTLHKLALALPQGKPLRGEMQGELLGRTFTAALRGGKLAAIMQEAHVPIDLELQAGSASARIHAELQPNAASPEAAASFELTAPHSGEVAAWLGLKPGADAPLHMRGNFHADNANWHLSDFILRLGRSDLSADVQRILAQGKPLLKLQLSSEQIDAEELQALLATGGAKATTAAANLIDIPILPTGIRLADADIAVRIQRIASTSPLAVRDLRFDGSIRDGMMNASPFAANVAGNNFSGAILLDLRTQQPHAVLWLAADALDVGGMLGQLGLAQDMDAGIGHLSMQLDLRSSRLGQLLAQSELLLDFEGGHLTLRDANTGGTMRIALDKGAVKSAAGAEIYLDLFGSLDSVPIFINGQTAKAADLINPDLSIPFKFNANTSGAAIQLSGNIARPFAKKDIELALDMSGSRLDNLDALAHASLPPWGPWSASGKFHMTSSGYEVPSLLLQIGSSQLSGNGKLDMQAVPPSLDVALTAPTIQLDDFRFGDWSPEAGKVEAKAKTQDELRQQIGEASKRAQKILSAEVLRRQNAHLTVRVDQVVSGADMLGNGTLEAQLENGRADIGPVIVNTPGGSALLRLVYEPGENDVVAYLRAEAKQFDYGVLARRMDPHSEMRGTFSLDVDVSARAQNLSELLRYGLGHLDFAVWPENLKSGLLDVWAVNVLMALLPAVDASKASKVNCAIGRFVLNDGKLSDKTILIDTSRMRVDGKGSADFATEDVSLYMQPRAKTPQFLSFAIPIELSGNFNDFHVGVRAGDVLGTVGQFVTSVIWVPLKMLFGKETPVDGRDVCLGVELR